jgi:hypothetical protein
MKKWLVISNCQTYGIGNCLSLLCPQVEIEVCDIWNFQKTHTELQQKLNDYDCLIVNPEIQALGLADFKSHRKIIEVPGVWFTGFHPDICYLLKCGKPIKGVMDDYHSLIIFAAYKNKISKAKVRDLFCTEIFQALSYFDDWSAAKEGFLNSFMTVGIDLRKDFLKWSRNGVFMHSLNHPHIDVLYDICEKIAVKAGETTVFSTIRPHDNLIMGPTVPVYPEIGAYFGYPGDYNFKPAGAYKLISIDEFISKSYEKYDALGADDMESSSHHYSSAVEFLLEVA